jgi:hypothetical protein
MHCGDAQMAIILNITYVILDESAKSIAPLTLVQFGSLQRVAIPFSLQVAFPRRFIVVTGVKWSCI